MRTKTFRENVRTHTEIFRRLVSAIFRENRTTKLHLSQGETKRRAGGKDNGAPGTHRLTLPSRAQSRPTRDDEPEVIPLVMMTAMTVMAMVRVAMVMTMMMTTTIIPLVMMTVTTMMMMMGSGAIGRLARGDHDGMEASLYRPLPRPLRPVLPLLTEEVQAPAAREGTGALLTRTCLNEF